MNESKSDAHLLIHVGIKNDDDDDVKVLRSDGNNSFLGKRDVLKYGSLITLTVQNCTLNLLMRVSRTQKELFIASTAVILAEFIKLITCISTFGYSESCRSVNCSLHSNLLYVGPTHLDAATCQITYQFKILTTALFSVAMLNK
uniref:Uncharacterized protein n=1 Tax=Tetranychus urticae TaxID=32264 RepID=T1K128_TETUR